MSSFTQILEQVRASRHLQQDCVWSNSYEADAGQEVFVLANEEDGEDTENNQEQPRGYISDLERNAYKGKGNARAIERASAKGPSSDMSGSVGLDTWRNIDLDIDDAQLLDDDAVDEDLFRCNSFDFVLESSKKTAASSSNNALVGHQAAQIVDAAEIARPAVAVVRRNDRDGGLEEVELDQLQSNGTVTKNGANVPRRPERPVSIVGQVMRLWG